MRPPRKPWATGASIKVQVDLPCKVFRTKNMLKPEVLNFFTCCPKKINKSRAFLSTRTYMYIYYIICTSWKRPIPNNKDKGQIDRMRRRPCTGGRVNNCYWTASLCTALMLKSLAPFMSRNNSDRFRDVERSMNFTWIRRYFTRSFRFHPSWIRSLALLLKFTCFVASPTVLHCLARAPIISTFYYLAGDTGVPKWLWNFQDPNPCVVN